MYRDTLLGKAVNAAIEEAACDFALKEDQKKVLLQLFDRAMDESLAQENALSTVYVQTKVELPRGVESMWNKKPTSSAPVREASGAADAASLLTLVTPPQEETRGNAQVVPASAALRSSSLSFPLYRCTDGIWTIILKDPDLVVRHPTGEARKLSVDYLRLYIKDCSHAAKKESKQSKKRQRDRHRH